MHGMPQDEPFQLEEISGAVTFLDVLGWKGIWEKRNDAIAKLSGLIFLINDLAKITSNEIGKKHKEARGIKTTVLSISDTIAIFTPGDPYFSLSIHSAICSKAIPESIKNKIPLRGATSYGKYSVHENIMVGPAVDEAASWHESTNWIGVVMTPSPMFHLKSEFPESWDTYEQIPYKKAVKGLNKCVRWDIDEHEVQALFAEMGPHIPEIAPKYLNTLTYLKTRRQIAQ